MQVATDRTHARSVLINSFHGTRYYSTKTVGELSDILFTAPEKRTAAERALVRKIAGHLCGIEGCTCGRNEFNER